MTHPAAEPAAGRPSMAARRRVWLGAALLVVTVALVPVWLGWDRGDPVPIDTPTPAATATPTAPPADDAADDPGTEPADDATGPTPTPETTAQPDITPAPLPDPDTAEALTGTAEVDDPEGDVLDAGGEPAEADAAVDLRRVALDGDGGALTITWEVAGPVPSASPGSLLWSVDLHSGDDLAASITVQQIGARRIAGVLDWSTNEQTVLTEALEVDGATLRLEVPIAALPRITAPVTWSALGQADGGLEDVAPEQGRAGFPG